MSYTISKEHNVMQRAPVIVCLLIISMFVVASCGETEVIGEVDGQVVKQDGSPPGNPDAWIPPEGDGSVTPGTDSSVNPPPPTELEAHIDEGCNGILYQVNIGTVATFCSTMWTISDDVIQVTVGDNNGLPPAAGRTYTVKDQSEVDIWPADGEALAVYSMKAGGIDSATEGTFTVAPSTPGGNVGGTYSLRLSNGQLLDGEFVADICPFDPTACD